MIDPFHQNLTQTKSTKSFTTFSIDFLSNLHRDSRNIAKGSFLLWPFYRLLIVLYLFIPGFVRNKPWFSIHNNSLFHPVLPFYGKKASLLEEVYSKKSFDAGGGTMFSSRILVSFSSACSFLSSSSSE